MSIETTPAGMHAVTPHIVCADADSAIDFYAKAFDAVEITRLAGGDGKLVYGAIRIGDSMVMLGEEMPAWGSLGPKALKGTPVVLHLYVPDVDAAVAQATAAGCTLTMPVADMFWGDRYGQVVDPYGHRWSLATHVRDVTPAEMQDAIRQMGTPG